tara:strand:- start:4616 stop:4831 length:216 start_codon:yes stop_codon:yes gene_type:complete
VTSWLTQLKSKTESRFKEKQFIEIEICKHGGHIFFSIKIQAISEKVVFTNKNKNRILVKFHLTLTQTRSAS